MGEGAAPGRLVKIIGRRVRRCASERQGRAARRRQALIWAELRSICLFPGLVAVIERLAVYTGGRLDVHENNL
jgi:hypothetical protein